MRGPWSLAVAVFVHASCAGPAVETPALRSNAESDESVIRAEYRGSVELEAHLAKPGDTVPLQLGWAQTCAGDTCRVDRTTGAGDRARTGTIWSTREAVWVEGASARMSDQEAQHHRRLLRLFAPEPGSPGVEVAFSHPRLGTVRDQASYRGYDPQGAPKEVSIEFHDADVAWRGTLELHDSAPAALEVPAAPPPAKLETPSMTALFDGVWDVRVPAVDARSFVVEFPTFVTVLEAPWSSAVGEDVVERIAERLPDKPIRYVLYSHHHPHYTGGLRAFMAAGASVVAPSSHADFVRGIADLDFSLDPDRFAESGLELALISYDDSFTIAEAGQSLHVIDIGARSNHTAAYNVFWLPEVEALVQGDIGWFVSPGGEVRVGARSAGLLQVIDEHGLPVERLMQTWPVNTQGPTLDIDAFRAAFGG